MNGKNATYWIPTLLVSLAMLAGGSADLARPAELVEGMTTHLGYPLYFLTILGAWKVLGGLALLVPGLPRLKEWAYAGIVFDLTGAAASHLAAGDGADKVVGPLVLTGLAFVSWAMRPSSRRVGELPFVGSSMDASPSRPAMA